MLTWLPPNLYTLKMRICHEPIYRTTLIFHIISITLIALAACEPSESSPISVTALNISSGRLAESTGKAITPITVATTPDDATGTYTISPDITTDTGLAFDTKTGTISGTPTKKVASKVYTITFTAEGRFTGTAKVTLTVTLTGSISINTIVTPPPFTVGTEITPIQVSISPSDATGAFTMNLPSGTGLAINSSTGQITGSPAFADASVDPKTYTVTFTGSGEYSGIIRTATVTIDSKYRPADRMALLALVQMGSGSLRAADKLGNTGNFNIIDTSRVTSMDLLFANDNNFNGDITLWDTSGTTSMRQMFLVAKVFNQDIGGWDVSNVNNMSRMFKSASIFDQDIGKWNVGRVTDMSNMFQDARAFNQDISGWDVRKVTNMLDMFSIAVSFDQDIGKWNVGSVTNMRNMFQNAHAFNQDISEWNVSNVTNMQAMFGLALAFDIDIAKWDVGKVTDMSYMFQNASSFNQDLSSWSDHVASTIEHTDFAKKAHSSFTGNKLPYSSWR